MQKRYEFVLFVLFSQQKRTSSALADVMPEMRASSGVVAGAGQSFGRLTAFCL